MFTPPDIASFFERLPRFAFVSGVFLLSIGGVLLLGVDQNYVPDGSIKEQVVQIAPVLLLIGVGCLAFIAILRIIEALMSVPNRLKAIRTDKAEQIAEIERLIDNIRLVDKNAMLVLLFYMKSNSGRHNSLGSYPPFISLCEKNLIVEEEVSWSTGPPIGSVRVNPKIFNQRDQIMPSLEKWVGEAFGRDMTDSADVYSALKANVDRYRNGYSLV